jgi:hypothetical protein
MPSTTAEQSKPPAEKLRELMSYTLSEGWHLRRLCQHAEREWPFDPWNIELAIIGVRDILEQLESIYDEAWFEAVSAGRFYWDKAAWKENRRGRVKYKRGEA